MIKTESLVLARDGALSFNAYLAEPAAGTGKKPTILILSEMFGLNGPMRELAELFASRGHAAMVPNVFWRSETTAGLAYEGPERQVAIERLKTLDFKQIPLDLRAAVTTLRGLPSCSGKVASIGFCAGGTLAYLTAAHSGVDAAVSFYALGIGAHLQDLPLVRCPVQLHYGSRDPHVPMSEIDPVMAATRDHASIKTYLYDAGHSFFNKVRPTYDAGAAKLSEERINGLLASL
jgi:carboxymethylenebutenolidase